MHIISAIAWIRIKTAIRSYLWWLQLASKMINMALNTHSNIAITNSMPHSNISRILRRLRLVIFIGWRWDDDIMKFGKCRCAVLSLELFENTLVALNCNWWFPKIITKFRGLFVYKGLCAYENFERTISSLKCCCVFSECCVEWDLARLWSIHMTKKPRNKSHGNHF